MRAHEFTDQGAAGIILYAADTGRYGLQQRSDSINDGGLWAAWGGGREPGESLEQCARRELAEESGYTGPIKLKRLAENTRYVTFIGVVPHEFEPRPDPEWKDYCWVKAGDWPAPMHPGVAAALKNIPVNESIIVEYRNRLLQYVKSLLPTWPDYILKDWLVPNKGDFSNLPDTELKNGIMEKLQLAGLTPNSKWQLVPNMKFTMDMWEPMSKKRLIGRAGGHSDMGLDVPRDKERHATQAALAQQQGGIRKEPVILIKRANGYELLEGWHRTIQHFAAYPQGYTGPAYVAVAGAVNENFADGKVKGKSRPGRVKRAGASCAGSVTDLRAKARKYGGERGKMYHWCANMKGGKKKANEDEERYEGPYDGHNFGGAQIG